MLPLVVGAFVYQRRDTVASAQLLDEVLRITASRYVDSVPPNDLYEKAAKGLVKELNDPYSVLWTKAEYDQFSVQTGGKYGGIGMEIAPTKGFVRCSACSRTRQPQPAASWKAIAFSRSTRRTHAAGPRRRFPTCSRATRAPRSTLNSAERASHEPIPMKFTRAIVHIPAVPYTLVLGNVGYIPLQQFNETAAQEVARRRSPTSPRQARRASSSICAAIPAASSIRRSPPAICSFRRASRSRAFADARVKSGIQRDRRSAGSDDPARRARRWPHGIGIGDRRRRAAGSRSRAHRRHDVVRQGTRAESLSSSMAATRSR